MKKRTITTIVYEGGLIVATIVAVALAYHSQLRYMLALKQLAAKTREESKLAIRMDREDSQLRRLRSIFDFSVLSDGARRIVGSDGQGRSLSYNVADGQRGTVLFSIDPDCSTCLRMLPFVDSLQPVSRCHFRFVGLFLGPGPRLKEFLRGHPLDFPMIQGASSPLFTFLPLAESPVIVAIKADGSVAGTWEGVLDSLKRANVRRLVAEC